VRCEDRVEKLVAAVPTVARWRLATVPAHLTSEEIGRFLDTFDRHSASGQRGYAMARCLSDMGLRASEVAAIQLDDLNWREGTLTIGRGKSRRADVLPLPVATGKALVQYLRGARPQSANRALFVRHRAPFNARSVQSSCGVPSAGFRRCGSTVIPEPMYFATLLPCGCGAPAQA